MKLHYVVLFAACFAALCLNSSAADKSGTKAADAVRAADQQWLKVFAAKDLEKSVAMCDEKGAVLAPNSPAAEGRDAISKSFAGFFTLPDLKIDWQADKVEVARSGELAYTSGKYQMTFTANGKTIPDNGKYVTVRKKQADGSWKVILDIFNTDLPAATP